MDDLHAPTVASGPTSSGASANSNGAPPSFNTLITQKENLEAELSALGSVLDSHGVTMQTSLTTFDGYPRADLDIAQIRTTRARIIRLRNDYKGVMAQVERAVHDQFANPPSSNTSSAGPKPNSASEIASSSISAIPSVPRTTAPIEPPFARVNSIVPDSPAAQAGLAVGDRIVRFGPVDWSNHERLTQVAHTVQQHENRTILVRILRDLAAPTQDLYLIPRRDWGGRGLLGCHLLPL